MDTARVGLTLGVLLVLAGCGQAITPGAPDGTVSTPSETATAAGTQTKSTPTLPPAGGETQMTPPQTSPANAGLQGQIETAKADLAQRLAISVDEIVLLEAASVTWPDASLGCPQEGMMYAQVLTPGYLIRLGAGNQEFEYHASRGTSVVYCENPMPPVPDNTTDT